MVAVSAFKRRDKKTHSERGVHTLSEKYGSTDLAVW
jgi:hypothetical protein